MATNSTRRRKQPIQPETPQSLGKYWVPETVTTKKPGDLIMTTKATLIVGEDGKTKPYVRTA